jgi:hypothetical protein
MISDTLFEAIEEIRDYQESMPKSYDEIRSELGVVVTLMEAMRTVLDIPPVPPYEDRAQHILKAIREIDLSAVKAALEVDGFVRREV